MARPLEVKIVEHPDPVELLSWEDLAQEEQEELSWAKDVDERDSLEFFRYKGYIYCLEDIVSVHPEGELAKLGWEGVHGHHAFAGIVVRFAEDRDFVIVGDYFV